MWPCVTECVTYFVTRLSLDYITNNNNIITYYKPVIFGLARLTDNAAIKEHQSTSADQSDSRSQHYCGNCTDATLDRDQV